MLEGEACEVVKLVVPSLQRFTQRRGRRGKSELQTTQGSRGRDKELEFLLRVRMRLRRKGKM
jgi:hypothetical protein